MGPVVDGREYFLLDILRLPCDNHHGRAATLRFQSRKVGSMVGESMSHGVYCDECGVRELERKR